VGGGEGVVIGGGIIVRGCSFHYTAAAVCRPGFVEGVEFGLGEAGQVAW
jgi:hypothetical protein